MERQRRSEKSHDADVLDLAGPKVVTASPVSTEVQDALQRPVAVPLTFVGAGQGGGRLAAAFWPLGYRRIAVVNTTSADFEGLPSGLVRVVVGQGGAAKDMEKAHKAFLERRADIYDSLVRAWGAGPGWCLVCASLGGGTGSGMAAGLIEMAREFLASRGHPVRVGALVSLPAPGEGQQTARNAVLALRRILAVKPSPLVVVDNQRVHQLYKPPMLQLFPAANQLAAFHLHLFNTVAAQRSPLMTFDQAELEQVWSSGLVTMADLRLDPDLLTSPADVSTAIRTALASSILADCDLSTGHCAACVFAASESVFQRFPADYFEAGFGQVERMLSGRDSVVHRGLYLADKQDQLRCYVMIGGLKPPQQRLAELAARGRVDTGALSLSEFLGV